MQTVVFLTGRTGATVFENLAILFADAFRRIGFEAIVLDFTSPEDALEKLELIVAEKNIYFVFGFIGMLKDLDMVRADGTRQNVWEAYKIPYIGMHGDTPAYFFDRHVNSITGSAMLYGFADHYQLRKTLPKTQGMFGVMRPYLSDTMPIEEMDFALKEKGKLFFLKNGNDPQALRDLWQEKFPFTISSVLIELGEVLVSRMATEAGPDIDKLVVEYFMGKGIDISALSKLRMCYIAQLDDYLRRVKSTLIAEAISDLPVEIHGVNWDHMNFTGKKCNFVNAADYMTSRRLMKDALGVIDMSPNTTAGFHDRPMRAFGMHTLCLTNRQDCMEQTFGKDAPFLFEFSKESIQAKVAEMIDNPKRAVEIGIEATRTFTSQFSEGAMVYSLIEIADQLRCASLKERIEGLQNFFVWPPLIESY